MRPIPPARTGLSVSRRRLMVTTLIFHYINGTMSYSMIHLATSKTAPATWRCRLCHLGIRGKLDGWMTRGWLTSKWAISSLCRKSYIISFSNLLFPAVSSFLNRPRPFSLISFSHPLLWFRHLDGHYILLTLPPNYFFVSFVTPILRQSDFGEQRLHMSLSNLVFFISTCSVATLFALVRLRNLFQFSLITNPRSALNCVF